MSRNPSRSRPLSDNVKRLMAQARESPENPNVIKIQRPLTARDYIYCDMQGNIFMAAIDLGYNIHDFARVYMNSQVAGVIDHSFSEAGADDEITGFLRIPMILKSPEQIVTICMWLEEVVAHMTPEDNPRMAVLAAARKVMAFSHREITPSNFLDHRQDTIWLDELHIKDIKRTPYTHFMPDDIVLRSFLHIPTERYFLKADRKEEDHITFFFTAPISTDSLEKFKDSENIGILPSLRLLNAPEGIDANGGSEAWSIAEYSEKGDTVTYWLRDTLLINQDTLSIEMTTLQTDTLGCLHITTDTLEVLPKNSFEKRMKMLN